LRLRWTDHALADLEELVERAPGQAGTVYEAVNWLARQRFPNLGRHVPEMDCRYWPVPPQGVFYSVEGGELQVLRIWDTRRRTTPRRESTR
jgi:plasmid stabilization system protein ParE